MLAQIKFSDKSPVAVSAGMMAPFFASLAAFSAGLLWKQAEFPDMLTGIALGWACSLFLVLQSLQSENKEAVDTSESDETIRKGLLLTLVFVIMQCAIIYLAGMRGSFSENRIKIESAALIFSGMIPFLIMLSSIFGWVFSQHTFRIAGIRASAFSQIIRAGFCILLFIAGSRFIDTHLLNEPGLPLLCLIGCVIGLLIWMFEKNQTYDRHSGSSYSLITGFLVISGYAVGFYKMNGFGTAIVMMSILLPLALKMIFRQEKTEDVNENYLKSLQVKSDFSIRILVMASLLILFRDYAVRYDHALRGAGLTDHFALIGFVTGVFLPGALSEFFVPRLLENPSIISRLLRLGLLAVFIICTPGILVLLWGAKCMSAVLAGLAISSLIRFQSNEKSDSSISLSDFSIYPELIAIALGLTSFQWTLQFLNLSQLSRADKTHILLWIISAIILVYVIADIGARLLHPTKQNILPNRDADSHMEA
jgi:hypothetical protein